MALFGTVWHCFGGCLSQKAKSANGLRQTKKRVGTLAIWDPKRVAAISVWGPYSVGEIRLVPLVPLVSIVSIPGDRDKKDKRYNDSTLREPLKLIARTRRLNLVAGAPARPIASLCEKRCRLEAGLPDARTMLGVSGSSLSRVATTQWVSNGLGLASETQPGAPGGAAVRLHCVRHLVSQAERVRGAAPAMRRPAGGLRSGLGGSFASCVWAMRNTGVPLGGRHHEKSKRLDFLPRGRGDFFRSCGTAVPKSSARLRRTARPSRRWSRRRLAGTRCSATRAAEAMAYGVLRLAERNMRGARTGRRVRLVGPPGAARGFGEHLPL